MQVQDIASCPGSALVILEGTIDSQTVVTFRSSMDALRARGVGRFVLDLEKVAYVNSSGVGYLISLTELPGHREGLPLVRVQKKVQVVFDMLGLSVFFKTFGSREQALAHLTGGDGPPAAPPKPAAGPALRDLATDLDILRGRRHANLWVVDPEVGPGRPLAIGFQVGAPREGALATMAFQEPAWQGAEPQLLGVTLEAEGAAVEPRGALVLLHPDKASDPVFFIVTPAKPELPAMRATVRLHPGGALLQELTSSPAGAPAE